VGSSRRSRVRTRSSSASRLGANGTTAPPRRGTLPLRSGAAGSGVPCSPAPPPSPVVLRACDRLPAEPHGAHGAVRRPGRGADPRGHAAAVRALRLRGPELHVALETLAALVAALLAFLAHGRFRDQHRLQDLLLSLSLGLVAVATCCSPPCPMRWTSRRRGVRHLGTRGGTAPRRRAAGRLRADPVSMHVRTPGATARAVLLVAAGTVVVLSVCSSPGRCRWRSTPPSTSATRPGRSSSATRCCSPPRPSPPCSTPSPRSASPAGHPDRGRPGPVAGRGVRARRLRPGQLRAVPVRCTPSTSTSATCCDWASPGAAARSGS
jgi:hypothetical protein